MVFAKNAERRKMGAESSSAGNNAENVSADIPVSLPEDSTPDTVRCPRCGAVVAEDAAYCPDCKWRMTPLSTGERAAAAIAYLPLLPPGVILALPAFRKNRYVRFHAWQSLALWVVFFVLLGGTILLSSFVSPMGVLLFGILIVLAMLFLWMVLTVKAWQGVRFELPLFGELAARMA
jgi:uncharacterized membrane protein